MSDDKRACATPGCILWSAHVVPCTTTEQLIRAMDDKDAVLAERDALAAKCKKLETQLAEAREHLTYFKDADLSAEIDKLKTRETVRMDAARWLFEAGIIDDFHDEGCPEDDTCDCLAAIYVSAVLNDPEFVPTQEKIEARRRRRAAAEKETHDE